MPRIKYEYDLGMQTNCFGCCNNKFDEGETVYRDKDGDLWCLACEPTHCDKCDSINVEIERYKEPGGAFHAGVMEIMTVEILACKDCGYREEL